MIPLLIALVTASAPAVDIHKQTRLAVFIAKKNPKSAGYALDLATRILIEAKRRNIPPEVMVAIAWTETKFSRGYRGTKGEMGLWQLGAIGGDHRLAQGWDEIRRLYPQWKIVKVHGAKPWKRIWQHGREQILDDVKAGTYLVALELWSVRRTCYRMRNWSHNSGGKYWPPSRWYQHRGVDVYGHYQSGTAPPTAVYLRAIRRRAARAKRVLEGKP